MHEHASARRAVEQMIRSGDLENLLRQAETMHGHRCPGLALGVKAGQYAMNYLGQESTGMEEVVAMVECNNCLVDGIQVVTGCTFGNNGLIFKDLGKMAVTVARRRDGGAVRLAVQPDFRERLFARYPAVGPLFHKVMVQRQGTPEDHHRFKHLWEAVARRELLEVPLEEQLMIQTLNIRVPALSRMHPTVVCSGCGEGVMETRVGTKEGRPLCRVCAGEEFGILTSNGINLIKESPLP